MVMTLTKLFVLSTRFDPRTNTVVVATQIITMQEYSVVLPDLTFSQRFAEDVRFRIILVFSFLGLSKSICLLFQKLFTLKHKENKVLNNLGNYLPKDTA